MHSTLALGSAVALLSGSALAAPPNPDHLSNRGQITVRYGDDNATLGCLNGKFEWVNDGNCENFRGLYSWSRYYQVWDMLIQNDAGDSCGGVDVMTCKPNNSSDQSLWSTLDPHKSFELENMLARGVIDTDNPCSVADVHRHEFETVDAVKIDLTFTPEESSTNKAVTPRDRLADRRVKRGPAPTAKPTLTSDDDATCTGTFTSVTGDVTATQLPHPTPSNGAFQSETGRVTVSKGGKEAGCLNTDGQWTAKQSDCVTYEAKWVENNSRLELVSQDVNGYCRFRNDELICDGRRHYTYLTFLVDGLYLVNPSSQHIVPVGSDQSWNTTFSAGDLPSGGNAVGVHKRYGATAIKLGWQKLD